MQLEVLLSALPRPASSIALKRPLQRILVRASLHGSCNSSRLLCAGLLVVSLVTPAAAQAPPSDKGKVWTIRDQFDGKSELSINSELVVLVGYQILAANITQVLYDQQARSKGAVLADNLAPILWTGYPIGAALIMAPFKTRRHYITLNWNEGSEPRELTFRAEKGHYKAILQELARVTGKPWRDLAAELKQERREAKPLVTDRTVEVGGVRLKAGTYRVAVRERLSDLADAVFYAKGRDPVALVEVKLVRKQSPVKSPQPVYGGANGAGIETLIEIVMPDQTLQLAPPQRSEKDGDVLHRLYAGASTWLVVRRGAFRGVPAATVKLAHVHGTVNEGWVTCEGVLYVTPTSVIFDGEAGPSGEKHDFAGLRGAASTQWLSEGHLQLEWEPSRIVTFQSRPESSADAGPLAEGPEAEAQASGAGPSLKALDYHRARATETLARYLAALIQNFDVLSQPRPLPSPLSPLP